MKIASITQKKLRRVNVVEWGCDEAYVKNLSAFERLIFNDLSRDYADRELAPEARIRSAARIAVLCLVDAAGEPLLSDDNLEEIEQADFSPIPRILILELDPSSNDTSFKKN